MGIIARIFSGGVSTLSTMLVSPSQAMKGRLLLLLGWLRKPVPQPRSPEELRLLARELRCSALYGHSYCPRSIRLRRLIAALNLPLEFRDIRRSEVYVDDLLAGVGRLQTPSLRIMADGRSQWLCGENQITDYLSSRYAGDQQRTHAA